MPIQNPKELFVWMLSDVRNREERGKKTFLEISKEAKDPQVKQTLEAYVFAKDKIISTLDECFRLIGQKPMSMEDKFHQVIAEHWRDEYNEIQNPMAKSLFLLFKVRQLMQWHVGEYSALVAMADYVDNRAVGGLIEVCLSDNLTFVERFRRRIWDAVEEDTGLRRAA